MKRSLELKGIGKIYDDFTALYPTDLTIAAGEFMTFLGPSGSGKTSLLMTIAGFLAPSSGRLFVDDRDITELPPEQRDFGVVFQGYALFPHLTVRGNIDFPLRARGIRGAAAKAKIDAVIELTQLGRYADRKPSELSGGQQQRVALARALVFEPELLLLDEPLSALDKNLRKDLQAELKDLHRRIGTTFICVTHDQEEALALSDRIAILRDGLIQQLDTPRALYERPKTAFVAGFLGKSNLLTGKVASVNAGRLTMTNGAITVEATAAAAIKIGDQAELAIRPEHLRLSADRPSTCVNVWRARIANITYLGAMAEVDVSIVSEALQSSDRKPTALTALVPAAALDTHETDAEIWGSCAVESVVVLENGGSDKP